jgi:hypothetical protein
MYLYNYIIYSYIDIFKYFQVYICICLNIYININIYTRIRLPGGPVQLVYAGVTCTICRYVYIYIYM